MPSLCEAMDRATASLYKAGDGFDELIGVVRRLSPMRRLPQPYDAFLKAGLWLLSIACIDRLAGHPSVLQLLYLAPIWLAFETAGLGVAACVAVAVVPVSALMSPPPHWGLAWDLVVRSALMISLIAIMTHHGRRYSVTRESAQRDALTGALNRAGFEEAARADIDAALSAHETATVAVIDCDNFKELNDLKGHAFGDQVLRALVRALNSSLEGATIGRTGGDEFVIVDRRRNATEVRGALGHAFDRFTDSTLVMGRRATFTVGIAQLGSDGMRYESLLESADRDMYRGKFARYETTAA